MSTTKRPYRISEIKYENIRYVEKKKTPTKNIIYVKYEDKGKLTNFVIQTPSLRNVNNIISKSNVGELDIPLIGQNKEKTDLFVGFLNNLDKQVINDAKINTDWFDDFHNNNDIKYQKCIRSSDEYKNGMIRVKLLRNDNFETIMQIKNKTSINFDENVKNNWVKMILEVYAIWITQDGFGIFLRPILVSFSPIQKIQYNYSFIDESDNEDDVLNTVTNESVFIKQDSCSDDNNGETSILEMPYNNNISSTSSE